MEFTVSPGSKIKDFDFAFFEGPDAPAGQRKLMNITLFHGEKQTRFQVPLGGWWSAEIEDGFTFRTSSPTRDGGAPLWQVAEGILAGADRTEVSVWNGTDRTKTIAATFSILSGREHFQALMQGVK